MGKPSNFSPLSHQSRKRRTTNRTNVKALAAVMVICMFLKAQFKNNLQEFSEQEFKSSQVLVALEDKNATAPASAGARGANGNWGYVADVTRIRRWMLQRYREEAAGTNATVSSSSSSSSLGEAANEAFPPSSYLPLTANETEKVCGLQPGMGHEGTYGWNVTIKVVLDGSNPLPRADNVKIPTGLEPETGKNVNTPYLQPTHRITTPEPNGVSKGKILCGIYSFPQNAHRIQAISETWGWRCDGFLPISTVTIDNPAIVGYGSVDVPHDGPEMYKNMWQKTRSRLAYMYDNYFGDYEYFYLVGDDTHVIVENLRRYLYTVEQTHDVATEPLFMGALTCRPRFMDALTCSEGRTKDFLYNDGGAGYVLNRVALKRLVLEDVPSCHAERRFTLEDMLIALCFKDMQINRLHTVDAQGRQRFITRPTDVLGSLNGTEDFVRGFAHGWASKYGWKTGADLVSESSVAFHLRGTDELAMKRHHAMIYDSCPVGTVVYAAVQKGLDARDKAFLVNVTKLDDSIRAHVPTAASALTSTLYPNPDRIFWCGYDTLFGDSDFNLAKVLFPGVPAKGFKNTMEFGSNDILLKTQNGLCPTAKKGKEQPKIEDVFPGKIMYVDGESSEGPPPTHERIYSLGPRADSNKTTRSYFGAMVLGMAGPETQKKIFDHQFRVKNTKKKFLTYMVSNCVEFREKAFTDLSNIATVHFGGFCSGLAGGNRTNIQESQVNGNIKTWMDNSNGVFQDYRFGLVMENQKSDGYITEKMVNAFLSGTVPIWYGTREVFDVFNERAFVFYDIKEPQPALDRIMYLEKNETAYDEIQNEPILANGDQTIEDYFSLRDDVGGGKLKKRIRNMLGYQ
jgi:hypothetical protein